MTPERDDLVLLEPGTAAERAAPERIGAKAANLLRMVRLDLPTPPAFVLGTALCRRYQEEGRLPDEVDGLLARGIAWLEEATGRSFGSARRPLVVAVRSGAAVSMPGMMDTVLDVGLTPASVSGLIRTTGNPRLAWDSYRRLVEAYAEVVAGLPPAPFEELVDARVKGERLAGPRELDAESLRELCQDLLRRYRELAREPFPDDPRHQLREAVAAVFRSWNGERARQYRRLNGIPEDGPDAGAAATVQAMVFGNSGGRSGSGVGFTRDPSTGEPGLYLDFLFHAQGEDVVAGRRTLGGPSLFERLPHLEPELAEVARRLEREMGDLQDFEITVEDGRLYLLQTRDAKRTPWAALRVAVDLVDEGLLSPTGALARLEGVDLEALERLRLDTSGAGGPLATAVAASLGVASGPVALTAARAQEQAAAGAAPILVRPTLETDDVPGLAACAGVLTATGGRTSHAAVVARQMDKVCLVGCRDLVYGAAGSSRSTPTLSGRPLSDGDELTLDGNTGHVYAGRLPVVRERPEAELEAVARWRGAARRRG